MRAFIETTILADWFLQTDERKNALKTAFAQFSERLLPEYAIKEFKAGPLFYFVYFHNKLVATKSYWKSLEAIADLNGTPAHYRTSGALQALVVTMESIGKKMTGQLVEQYGDIANRDEATCDEARYYLA
ncbi:hypothetical protein [Taklimakanibacter deserti]|uniref:hypothetical protein n=1 Tax=Taklimakanibacter deserti TaxID=2267839 RepID=UPI000E64720C